MKQDPNCDCPCHPSNGLEATQKRWQFGTLTLGGTEQPCYCCWCHYDEKKAENDVDT